jgi:U3 small nucleolar ribonucleoprotein protein IMP4
MIRRNARLRKEYIYRKSLEGTERDVYEKKRKIKEALKGKCKLGFHSSRLHQIPIHSFILALYVLCFSAGKPIPDLLREDYHELKKEIDLEDAATKGLLQLFGA